MLASLCQRYCIISYCILNAYAKLEKDRCYLHTLAYPLHFFHVLVFHAAVVEGDERGFVAGVHFLFHLPWKKLKDCRECHI